MSILFRVRFQPLFVMMLDSRFRRAGLVKPGFRMESIVKTMFSLQKSCFGDSRVELWCFSDAS